MGVEVRGVSRKRRGYEEGTYLSPIIRPETVHRVQEVLPFGGSRGEVDGVLREVNQPPTPGSPWG